MDRVPFISTPPPRDGKGISSNQPSYINSLKLAESGAQLAKFDNVKNIYIKLLNDSSLGYQAHWAINVHIVATYQKYGGERYEWHLTDLFQKLSAEVSNQHKEINVKLANSYKDKPTNDESGSLGNALGKYDAHLHIASILGDLTSSQSLCNMYVECSDVEANSDLALRYAIYACLQGDRNILFRLSKHYEEQGMNEAAQKFYRHAEIHYDPEIRPEKIDVYVGEELKFKLVDTLIAMKLLDRAEDTLKKIAADHLTEKQQHQLFSAKPIISNIVLDWYCDHGPIYTRIALKLAKIYYVKGPKLHDKKIQELIGIIDATASSTANNDIKLELGEWYLTRSLFVDSKDKEGASNLLEQIDVRKIPDTTYPKMKELHLGQIKKFF